MSLLTERAAAAGMVGSRIRATHSRSLAERAAAEAFVYLMNRCRVACYEVAVEAWIGATDRPVVGGTNREIVRRYRAAPPFWALTVNCNEEMLTGYGMNMHAVVIRYARRVIPLNDDADGFSSLRTEFGPGCRELLRRAKEAFICEAIPPGEAEQVAKAYLIDAALSQAAGRGPLVVSA